MRFGTLLTWFYDKDEIDRSPIEIRPLAMSMLVFICYGCLMTVAARISGWNLKSSVDGHVSSIMLEPFSINLFVIFSIISMIFLLIGIVKYKTNDDLRGSKFTKILLAPTINAALSAGSIMIGMLLGMSLGFVMAGAFVSAVNFFCAILSFHHHAGDSMDWSSACIVFKLGFFYILWNVGHTHRIFGVICQ